MAARFFFFFFVHTQKQEKPVHFLVFQDMQMIWNTHFICGEMWTDADVLLCGSIIEPTGV